MERGETETSLSWASTEVSGKAAPSRELGLHSSNARPKNLRKSLSQLQPQIQCLQARCPSWDQHHPNEVKKLGWDKATIPKSSTHHPKTYRESAKVSASPQGYPRLAAFLDSDESFMIYRRCGFIQSRLLLDKQDQLCELERKLEKMDRIEAKSDNFWARSKQRSVLTRIFSMRLGDAMHHPSKVDYKSVRNWMHFRNPLTEREASWVDHEEVMVTLRAGREHAWLDSGIEKLLKWFHCPLLERLFGDERSRTKCFGVKSSDIKSSDTESPDREVYYSRHHITRLANCIITFTILLLLIVPIYILYHLVTDVKTDKVYAICIGILVVATLAFSAVLSLFTKAKRHEILAAAAAYCAVLVVFLGNVGPDSRSSV
ncbi:hypothetical protein PMIN03_000755 [Paraphaeosphaeria minitans]